MYLVLGNDIVAYNDDYTGLASEIIYTPSAAAPISWSFVPIPLLPRVTVISIEE